jgi:hypothetical protein
LCLLAGMCEIFLSQPGMRVAVTHTMTSSAMGFPSTALTTGAGGLAAWGSAPEAEATGQRIRNDVVEAII